MADEDDGGLISCRIGSVVILFAALTGNIAELVLWCAKKSLRPPGQILIHSLSVVDTMLAVVLQSRVIHATIADTYSSPNVALRIGSSVLLALMCFIQLAHVLAIGGERFFAVRYPLRFQQTHTKPNIRKMLFIIWLIPCMLGAAIVALCAWMGKVNGIFVALSAAYGVTVVFLCVLYYLLIRTRRNHDLKVNSSRGNKNKTGDSGNIYGGSRNNDYGKNISNNDNSNRGDNTAKSSEMHERGEYSNSNHEILRSIGCGKSNSRNENKDHELSENSSNKEDGFGKKNNNNTNSKKNDELSNNENNSYEIKNNVVLISQNSNNADNIESNNNNGAGLGNRITESKMARDSRDKLLLILSIGIAGSFFLFNTPIIVYGILFDVQPHTCGSPKGVLLAFSTSCASLNLVAHPLLYFFISYRIRTRQASINKEVQQRNVVSKQGHARSGVVVGRPGRRQVIPLDLG